MAFTIEQRIGKYVYVYEVTSYWDKDKKQPRQKRKLLGRRDTITGKLIKTDRKRKNTIIKIQDYGNVYFLNNLWEKTKLEKIIKDVYPNNYNSIKGLVNYVISENKPFYLYSFWADYNFSINQESNLSSQRISDLLNSIGDRSNTQEKFFKLWIQSQKETEGFYFDITSLSTYSKELTLAEWGYNRDREKLRQINLGITYGIRSQLPLYYKLYQGSISDVSTLKNIVKYNKQCGLKGMTYILDRGFFSKSNLEGLENEKVIIPMTFSSKESQEILTANSKKLLNRRELFDYKGHLYYYAEGEKEIRGKRYKYHIFREKERYDEQETVFLKQLMAIEKAIIKSEHISEDDVKEHIENLSGGYSKYFSINKIENGYYVAEQNIEEIEKRINRFGTFILLTNLKNVVKEEVLKYYKQRDRVEKIFDRMKNDLDRNRLRVSNENRVKGSLFITFLALILLSHIDNILRDNSILKNISKQEIIYELKKIKVTKFEDGSYFISEISKKSKNIFKEFDIPIPSN